MDTQISLRSIVNIFNYPIKHTIIMSFSLSEYRFLLTQLKNAGYSSAHYSDIPKSETPTGPIVILRHDVDFSLENAARMASVEKELGYSATYFLHCRSVFYNVMHRDNVDLVRMITDLSHNIGVHFDWGGYPDSTSSSRKRTDIMTDLNVLSSVSSVAVNTVSFHRPGNLNVVQDIDLGCITHSYEERFTKHFSYLADSRGHWSHGHPLSSIAFYDRSPLHILTHPVWWNDMALSVKDCIDRFLATSTNTIADNLNKELDDFWRQ